MYFHNTHHTLLDIKKKYNDPSGSKVEIEEKQDIGYGYGWIILLLFYGLVIFVLFQDPSYPITVITITISVLGIVGLLLFYFWFRSFLRGVSFLKGYPHQFSSFLSGIVSYFVISILVGVLIGGVTGYLKDNNTEVEWDKLVKPYMEE